MTNLSEADKSSHLNQTGSADYGHHHDDHGDGSDVCPPMRIDLITETYPPEVNGVALTVRDWARGLQARGHHVRLIRPDQGKQDLLRQLPSKKLGKVKQAVDEDGLEHILVQGVPLPGYQGLRFGLPSAGKLKKLWHQDDPGRPDVIHVATEGPLGIQAMRLGRKLGLGVTSSFHTNFHEYLKHYRLSALAKFAQIYLSWAHQPSSSVIVATQEVAEQVAQIGVPHLDVLPRGVDTQLFDPSHRSTSLRDKWGVDENTLVVGYVGRLADEKSIPQTFEVYEKIKKVVPQAKMVVVGDGPIGPRLKKQYPDYLYCGMQHGQDLAQHFASIDLFVFASVTETFGNVVIEAMASGVGVVAYDEAAAKRLYMQDPHALKVAKVGDEIELADQALQLATDTDLLQKTKQCAIQAAGSHSWSSVMARYETWLKTYVKPAKVSS